MIELDFYINGKPAATPKNAKEIKLISNWNNDSAENKSEAEISTNSLQFVLEDAKEIADHVAGGVTGTSPGIFEGVPYAINLKDISNGTVSNILDGYIDLADEATFISCDEVESSIKKRKNLDWLTSRADSFSFAYLASTSFPVGAAGKINESDYTQVPYVLNHRPDSVVLTVTSVSLYVVTKELFEAVFNLIEAVANVFETTNPLPDVGDIIAAILKAAAIAVYIGIMIKAVLALIKELINQFFSPVRRYKALSVKTMFEKGCDFLGLQFASTIFNDPIYKELTIIPTKSAPGKALSGVYPNSIETGHPNQQSAVYNFGDFIRVMKQMFNAQIKLENGTLRFERWDYWSQKAAWTLPSVETDQRLRLSSFSYNTDEALSNFLLSFQTDYSDENTLSSFRGTNFQVITEPNSINNNDFINLGGLGEVRLPFALATPKTGLNAYEISLKKVAQIVDAITGAFSAILQFFSFSALPSIGTSFSSQISGRSGMMMLSNDIISVDKLVVMNNGNVIRDVGSVKVLSAFKIWREFHVVNSFVPVADSWGNRLAMAVPTPEVHNQHKLFTGVEIPFCKTDWDTLTLNNRFIAGDSKTGEVLRIEWDIYNEKAIIDYKIKEVYTKNLKFTTNEGS